MLDTQKRSDSHTQKGSWPHRFPSDIGDTQRLVVSVPAQTEPFSQTDPSARQDPPTFTDTSRQIPFLQFSPLSQTQKGSCPHLSPTLIPITQRLVQIVPAHTLLPEHFDPNTLHGRESRSGTSMHTLWKNVPWQIMFLPQDKLVVQDSPISEYEKNLFDTCSPDFKVGTAEDKVARKAMRPKLMKYNETIFLSYMEKSEEKRWLWEIFTPVIQRGLFLYGFVWWHIEYIRAPEERRWIWMKAFSALYSALHGNFPETEHVYFCFGLDYRLPISLLPTTFGMTPHDQYLWWFAEHRSCAGTVEYMGAWKIT